MSCPSKSTLLSEHGILSDNSTLKNKNSHFQPNPFRQTANTIILEEYVETLKIFEKHRKKLEQARPAPTSPKLSKSPQNTPQKTNNKERQDASKLDLKHQPTKPTENTTNDETKKLEATVMKPQKTKTKRSLLKSPSSSPINKKPKPTTTTSEQLSPSSSSSSSTFHCIVCSKNFTSQKDYRVHYNSNQHKQKIDGFRRQDTGDTKIYHCSTCSLDFPNPNNLVRHFGTKYHRDVYTGVSKKRQNSNNFLDSSIFVNVSKPPPLKNVCELCKVEFEGDFFSHSQTHPQHLLMVEAHKMLQLNNNRIQVDSENEVLRQQVLSRKSSKNINPIATTSSTTTATTAFLNNQPSTTVNQPQQLPLINSTNFQANQILTNLALAQILINSQNNNNINNNNLNSLFQFSSNQNSEKSSLQNTTSAVIIKSLFLTSRNLQIFEFLKRNKETLKSD